MASELFNARSDFASLGGSIASFQQNALDDQVANNATLQNYGNVSAQLKASIPSSFGDIAFGAYELLGQGKDLISRISKVKSDISALPATIKESLVKGGNKLGARVEEGKTLVSETGAQLQTTTEGLSNTIQQTAEQLRTTASGATEGLQTAVSGATEGLQTAVSGAREGLQTAVSGATEGLQTAVSGATLDPLQSLGPIKNATTTSTFMNPIYEGPVEPVSGFDELMTQASKAGYRSTAPYLNINPTEELTTRVAGLQQEGGTVLANIQGAGRTAQQALTEPLASVGGKLGALPDAVTTTLSSATQKGGALVSDVVGAGTETATKVASTLETAGAGALNLAKGGVADVAETVAEVSSSFLPVVGEVTALALGGVQIYEGFKDLFDHPSASKPVTVPLPSVANIAQGFQSGI